MYKIAVLGEHDSIYGYGALGLDLYPVSNAAKAAETLHYLARNDTAVIYVTESLAAQIDPEIQKYNSRPLPAVILIPGVSGNTGLGLYNVRRSVEKAVGSDILFGGQIGKETGEQL